MQAVGSQGRGTFLLLFPSLPLIYCLFSVGKCYLPEVVESPPQAPAKRNEAGWEESHALENMKMSRAGRTVSGGWVGNQETGG